MNTQEIYTYLQESMPELEVKQNENMAKHTSFQVGGNADIWIKVKTVEQLTKLLNYAKEIQSPLPF